MFHFGLWRSGLGVAVFDGMMADLEDTFGSEEMEILPFPFNFLMHSLVFPVMNLVL